MTALPVRRKLQLGILGLVVAILVLSWFITQVTVNKEAADERAPLREFAGQFDHFRRTEGEAMYGAIAVATDDAALELAISKGDSVSIAKEFERSADDIRRALDLDLEVILGHEGQVLTAPETPGNVAAAIKELRSFRDALADVSVRDAVEYIGGEAYQVSAEPMYQPGAERSAKTVTSVMMIGRRLSSILREFATEHPQSGLEIALAHEGRVFGASQDHTAWPGLDAAIGGRTGGAWAQVTVNGVSNDLFIREIDSCGGACVRVAQIAVLRSRAPIEAERRKRLVEQTGYLLLVLVAALGGGWVIARWITHPIERYVDATRALAKGGGDLTQRLDESTDDELGRLGKNLNDVFTQIGTLAQQVKERAQEVGSASDEIRTASRALLDGAAEQAARIQSTGAATTEMSASIQQVASSAAEANGVAQRSSSAVEDAVRRMEQIREAVDRAAQRMALLGETGKRIGTIVDTIHTIADQTSLLALNAAIEAAHAGEHGRGFTVVADAVGQLATRVDRSAKEIDELIGQIRAQTEEALAAMSDGKREVENGTKLIADSIAGIKQVLHVFDDTTAAVKEQAIASDEIARNMEAVGRIAQEVLVTSRQAVNQGDRLTTIATSLEEAVAGFRLEESHSRPLPRTPDRPLLRG
jgi:methyl-accepting chemotaxis protein